MALPPKDWPDRLPSLPSDTSKCDVCQNFAFEPGSVTKANWEQRRQLKEYYWRWELYGPQCQFCNVIRETFWHIAETLGYQKYKLHKDFWFLEVSLSFREEVVTLQVQPAPKPEALAKRWADQQWHLALPHKASSLPWSHIPKVQHNPGSIQKAADTILEWLGQCIHDHKSNLCRSLRDFMPTRLIQIDSHSRALRLVDSKGSSVPYTALSYCWGRKPEEETVKQNLHRRLQGHELDRLPKLLGDAIQLTVACNIKYIWIDAICIVQDDDEDRERELSQMGEIYSHATFTISAAYAGSVQQALIAPERAWIRIQNQLADDSSTSSILARSVIQHDPIGLLLPGEPTWPAFDRCWTFQERVISTRVVHFAPDELIWECASRITCDCRFRPKLIERDSIRWAYDQLRGEEHEDYGFHIIWRSLVTASAQRRLSRDRDRLVAIGGLAKRLARQAGGRLGSYYAGIWESDLRSIYGLSWHGEPKASRKRPQDWVAPSWSWASLKSEIVYPQHTPDRSRSHTRVDKVHCPPRSSQNPYGEVESGEIVLTGSHLDIVIDGDNLTELLRTSMAAAESSTDIKCVWHWDIPVTDADREVVNGDSLILILLWSAWPIQSLPPNLTFMALKRHPRYDATWTRVGVAWLDFLEGGGKETTKLDRYIDSLATGTFRVI